MIGVEPWARGLRIARREGGPTQAVIDLRLLRLERSPGRVGGEYRPIVEETIALYHQDGKQLPPPTSGRDIVNKVLGVG